MMPTHARVRNLALLVLIVFSSGFTPIRVGWFLNAGQFAWTEKVAELVAPLVWPTACKLCAPGCADCGMVTECVKFPVASAVADPEAAVSNARFTVSPAENPEPVIVT